jgi:hypothetical protein
VPPKEVYRVTLTTAAGATAGDICEDHTALTKFLNDHRVVRGILTLGTHHVRVRPGRRGKPSVPATLVIERVNAEPAAPPG